MHFPVSICILSRNSEKFIVKCLQSLNDFKEIIIIDTGSDDQTLKIAKDYTDKIYSFEWNNNFSDARNYAFQFVTEPWVLWLDSDEELIISDKTSFNNFLMKEGITSFSFLIENILDNNEISSLIRYRLLKTESNYKFTGYIHEVANININQSFHLEKDTAYIKHYGYNSQYVDLKAKNARNISILKNLEKKYLTGSWEHINYLIYLVKEISNPVDKNKLLLEIENLINNYSEKDIKNNIVTTSFYQEIIKNYSILEIPELEEFYCLKGMSLFPEELNLLAMAGELYYKSANYKQSINLYNKILELVEKNTYLKSTYIHSGIKDYGTYYNLALCYIGLNDNNEAKKYLKKSLEINPSFLKSSVFLKQITI